MAKYVKDTEIFFGESTEAKPTTLPQGSKYQELDTSKWFVFRNGEWVESTEDAIVDVNFIGIVSADGDAGITGSKTVGGYKITFKKGLLTGFEAV